MMEQASSYSNSEFKEAVLLYYSTYNYFGDPSITVIPNNSYCRTKYIRDVLISDRTYNSCKIDVINTSIEMDANIIFKAEESTTIHGPFEVGLGSSLEVK